MPDKVVTGEANLEDVTLARGAPLLLEELLGFGDDHGHVALEPRGPEAVRHVAHLLLPHLDEAGRSWTGDVDIDEAANVGSSRFGLPPCGPLVFINAWVTHATDGRAAYEYLGRRIVDHVAAEDGLHEPVDFRLREFFILRVEEGG